MISSGSSEVNTTSYNRKVAQQLRSAKPESLVDAYREVRVLPKGWYLLLGRIAMRAVYPRN